MNRFLKTLIIETVVILTICFFPLLSLGKEYWFEFICAYSVSILNAIVGYYLTINSLSKSNNDFYKIVYGGMLARMIFVLGFIIYMISNELVSATPFFLSMMVFYTIHQWTEISGWLKELPARKVPTNE